MLWRGGRRSDNIEDRRGGGGFTGGSFGGGRLGGGGMKIGGFGIVVILLVGWFFGVDPSALLSQIPVQATPTPAITVSASTTRSVGASAAKAGAAVANVRARAVMRSRFIGSVPSA